MNFDNEILPAELAEAPGQNCRNLGRRCIVFLEQELQQHCRPHQGKRQDPVITNAIQ